MKILLEDKNFGGGSQVKILLQEDLEILISSYILE